MNETAEHARAAIRDEVLDIIAESGDREGESPDADPADAESTVRNELTER
ncbi:MULTISPECIES: hypothetical protein [Actinomycetes]|nr:hypothetical protein [Corynebacterium doosanense]